MGDELNLIFRLPQSLVRALGIKEIEKCNFYQANVHRHQKHKINSLPYERAIFNLNSLIVAGINKRKKLNFLNLFDDSIFFPQEVIVDYNLLTSIETFKSLKNIKNISVLPYNSATFNPVIQDLFSIKGFSKCLKDSFEFSKKVKPRSFYNWVEMISGAENTKFLPWFWTSKSLSRELYLFNLKKVAAHLSGYYIFLKKFLNAEDPILIQYTELNENEILENLLNELFSVNSNFRNKILKKKSIIFIKPHRSNFKFKSYSIRNFKGTEIVYPLNMEESLIPSEIFINSRDNSFLFISEWSSSLINFQIREFIPIKRGFEKKNFTYMRLSLNRFARNIILEDYFD